MSLVGAATEAKQTCRVGWNPRGSDIAFIPSDVKIWRLRKIPLAKSAAGNVIECIDRSEAVD